MAAALLACVAPAALPASATDYGYRAAAAIYRRADVYAPSRSSYLALYVVDVESRDVRASGSLPGTATTPSVTTKGGDSVCVSLMRGKKWAYGCGTPEVEISPLLDGASLSGTIRGYRVLYSNGKYRSSSVTISVTGRYIVEATQPYDVGEVEIHPDPSPPDGGTLRIGVPAARRARFSGRVSASKVGTLTPSNVAVTLSQDARGDAGAAVYP